MSGSPADRSGGAAAAAALTLLLMTAGCAYSFTSGLPAHIKTVAVPLFANETNEFGIAEEVTEQLVAALVKDGTLRIVSEAGEADAVIEGTVRAYSEEAYAYDRDETVDQQIIRITVSIRFYDQVREEVIWESDRVFGSQTYPNEGPDARDGGLEKAIGQVVDEILSGIVAGW